MKELPNRKKIRIDNYDYSSVGAYFVTICTENRQKTLWNTVGADIIRPDCPPLSNEGKIVEEAILQIPGHYENVRVDKYCIMPDHVHLLLSFDAGGRMISAPTLSNVVGSMKRWVSKQIGRPIWQKSFYEHSVRNQADYDEIWAYIENNPLKYSLQD